MNVAKHRKMLVALSATFVVAGVWLYLNSVDSGLRRRLAASKVKQIASDASANPEQTEHALRLIGLARSDYTFEAGCAAAALGDIGRAAEPVIHDIAALMDSPVHVVRREAARSLSRLGKRSEPALPLLVAKVQNGSPNEDSTWFAAQAIGNTGAAALEFIPVLESKVGTGSSQFDDSLNRAIKRIHEDAGQVQAEEGSAQ